MNNKNGKYGFLFLAAICITFLSGCGKSFLLGANNEEPIEHVYTLDKEETDSPKKTERSKIEKAISSLPMDSDDEKIVNEKSTNYEDIYKEFMKNYESDYHSFDPSEAEYHYEDLNSDGIPELFFNPGDASTYYEVYTCYENKVNFVGEEFTSPFAYYIENIENTPYFLQVEDFSYEYGYYFAAIQSGEAKYLLELRYDDFSEYEYGDKEYTGEILKPHYYDEIGNEVDEETYYNKLTELIGTDNVNKIRYYSELTI